MDRAEQRTLYRNGRSIPVEKASDAEKLIEEALRVTEWGEVVRIVVWIMPKEE